MRCKKIHPANTSQIDSAVHRLTMLVATINPNKKDGDPMSAPTDLVSISQSVIEGWATTVNGAVTVLGPYIQQLIAGESVQLSAANIADVTAALQSLVTLEPAAPASS